MTILTNILWLMGLWFYLGITCLGYLLLATNTGNINTRKYPNWKRTIVLYGLFSWVVVIYFSIKGVEE